MHQNLSQYYYAPFALHYNVGNATALASPGLRIPLPGGGQANAGSAGVTYYCHPNWQGSQPLNTTPTRTVAADNSFTPFGERYALNSYSGYFAGMLMHYPFMTDGYQADYRMYHEAQSRWVSPDPAGMSAVYPTNPHRYAYAGNNPLSNIDPSGLGNCQYPLIWVPNLNGDGGACYSAPGVTIGSCAQAMQYSGGSPVAGCPGSPPNGPQTGTGTGAQGNFQRLPLPANHLNCTTSTGASFPAPPRFSVSNIAANGAANGLSGVGAAVGHGGYYGFQRFQVGSVTQFFKGYTPVANVAVGAYVQGTGAPQWVASLISNTYAFFNSSNGANAQQAQFRGLGFSLAAGKATYSCHP